MVGPGTDRHRQNADLVGGCEAMRERGACGWTRGDARMRTGCENADSVEPAFADPVRVDAVTTPIRGADRRPAAPGTPDRPRAVRRCRCRPPTGPRTRRSARRWPSRSPSDPTTPRDRSDTPSAPSTPVQPSELTEPPSRARRRSPARRPRRRRRPRRQTLRPRPRYRRRVVAWHHRQ